MNRFFHRSYILHYRSKFIHRLFPPVCFGCNKEGSILCQNCHKELQAHPELCPVCHRFSQFGQTCLNCYRISHLDGVMIGFSYTGAVKSLIKKLKYNHIRSAAQILGQKIGLLLSTTPFTRKGTYIITYVPIHRRKKHMIRGYNQAELLANTLGQQMGVPITHLFSKTRRTRSQTHFSKTKRVKNIANSFSLQWSLQQEISTIFIVDDVFTTGSTLQELARLLKEKYPSVKVYGLTVARRG